MKFTLIHAEVMKGLQSLVSESVDLCVTSPPYWGLRSYGVEGELGAEATLEAYLDNLMAWVKEVHRVLKPSGSFVLNLGGSYYGGAGRWGGTDNFNGIIPAQKGIAKPNKFLKIGKYKPRQFLDAGAFAYTRIISGTDFVCRNRAVWCKPNVPSPIRSRLKQSTESMDWFVKNADKNYFNARPWMKNNKTTTINRMEYSASKANDGDKTHSNLIEAKDYSKQQTIEHSWRVIPVGEKQKGFELLGKDKPKQIHVAPYPERLIKPWVASLCPPNGVVLDPFVGSGTTMKVARDLGLNCIGIDLDADALAYAKKRLNWGSALNTDYEEVDLS